jgi:hypothetical protein
VQARDVLLKGPMTMWRFRSSALPFAAVVGAFGISLACSGELETNFGPPGGLEGQMLPMGSGGGGGGAKHDAGMMAKCTYKGKEAGAPAEAAPPPAEAGDDDGGATDGGATDGAADTDGEAPDTGTKGGADSGPPPVESNCAVSWTKDIFPNMTAVGAWQCGNAACHGPGGPASPSMTSDATSTYENLVGFPVENATGTASLPFIKPCEVNPDKSAFVYVVTGTTYGPEMPVTSAGGPAVVNPTQLGQIRTWIACGAIDN